MNQITAKQYADAVGNGMTEQEADYYLLCAKYEANYERILKSCRVNTRLSLELALIAYVNNLPMPKLGRRTQRKFNMSVKPYGDLLRWEKQSKSKMEQ